MSGPTEEERAAMLAQRWDRLCRGTGCDKMARGKSLMLLPCRHIICIECGSKLKLAEETHEMPPCPRPDCRLPVTQHMKVKLPRSQYSRLVDESVPNPTIEAMIRGINHYWGIKDTDGVPDGVLPIPYVE